MIASGPSRRRASRGRRRRGPGARRRRPWRSPCRPSRSRSAARRANGTPSPASVLGAAGSRHRRSCSGTAPRWRRRRSQRPPPRPAIRRRRCRGSAHRGRGSALSAAAGAGCRRGLQRHRRRPRRPWILQPKHAPVRSSQHPRHWSVPIGGVSGPRLPSPHREKGPAQRAAGGGTRRHASPARRVLKNDHQPGETR